MTSQGEAKHEVVPQADSLEKLRELVEFWLRDDATADKAKRALALAKRDYSYYVQAACVLGFLKRTGLGRVEVTPLGDALSRTSPHSQEERGAFVQAIERVVILHSLHAYLRGDEPLGVAELRKRVAACEGVSGQTVGRRVTSLRRWHDYLSETGTRAADSVAQLSLFDSENGGLDDVKTWPSHDRFPHNRSGQRVAGLVYEDLLNSKCVLIVSGYASLGEFLKFVGQLDVERLRSVRIILGNEPFQTQRRRFDLGKNSFSDEMRDYWLSKGISLKLSGAVIRAKGLIRSGNIQVRIPASRDDLHAKIYVGEAAVTIGSSNFTHPGLRTKREGNVRFRRRAEAKRYSEAQSLAETYWNGGRDYSEKFLAFLDELLVKVSWRHALARACAELLEGEWTEGRYQLPPSWQTDAPLWPSQRQGIAQALYILENVGSVLIADATGSGKTRMGAHLVAALQRHLVATGRADGADPVISTPPDAVLGQWQDELANCGRSITPLSHGVLSSAQAGAHENAKKALRITPVVVIDEAHNFLNAGSNRTRAILGNMANHTILFTATPVSRRPNDLLAVVDLLGADNFDDKALRLMQSLLSSRRGVKELGVADLEDLKREVSSFTLRRTRNLLNHMVDREPEAYLNGEGNPCRYPQHVSKFYDCNEPQSLLDGAAQISELASQLKGMLFLQTALELPDDLRDEGWDESRYLQMRLGGARGLAGHHIMASLRSSRAALYEHLLGTQEACNTFELREVVKSESGDVVGKLGRSMTIPPTCKLDCEVPQWLSDSSEFQAACEEDINTYRAIGLIAKKLPDTRENAKVRHLAKLGTEHGAVLAFDSRPITLAAIKRRLGSQTGVDVVIATGSTNAGRRAVTKRLARTSRKQGIIALCSDSMAEGFNLQRASAVVHLDMPAVLRIAEQRVGRVDRMDSPHAEIEAYWPDDPSEFALRGNERLIADNAFVASVLGANLILPDSVQDNKIVSAAAMSKALEREENAWDEDAFSPVRELAIGTTALVPEDIYEEVRGSTARIISAVSVVRSRYAWAFLAVGASQRSAPKWVYLPSSSSAPITNLRSIAEHLRRQLDGEPENTAFDTSAATQLGAFLDHLQACERELLPRRKRRALEQMERIVSYYRDQEKEPTARRNAMDELLGLLSAPSGCDGYDAASVAECWLEAVRPTRFRWLHRRKKRKRFALLKELDSDLKKHPLTLTELKAAFSRLQDHEPLAERIVAVILGVPAI